jgi:N-acyl-L-homoserine lactone synthetase
MQKLFGEYPLRKILCDNAHPAIWHIGRFAVAQPAERSCLSLFRQLIACAVFPVMHTDSGIMIAECDSKLIRILSALGVRINHLGTPIYYLGSETVPVSITRQGIEQFFNREYSCLMQKSSCNVKNVLSDMQKFAQINICA